MIGNLERVRNELIRLIKQINNKEWVKTDIIIQFPPFENRAYNTLPSFWDVSNNRLRLFPEYDEEFDRVLFDFITNANKNEIYNQISFHSLRDNYQNANIEISYNQKIVGEFEANLPKSQRGKTKAWYNLNKA